MKIFTADDNEGWKEIFVECLKDEFTQAEVTSFSTVDDLMSHMGYDPKTLQQTSANLNHPALIVSDGNTESLRGGVDLAKLVNGMGIGVVVVSANREIASELENSGCKTAIHIGKAMFESDGLIAAAKKSMENAMVEKLGIEPRGGRPL